ncbi:pilus assembly protein PilP [Thiohalobacter thiocyanaticus]|nr:pilus assembly protein PilP [Thiohalobacter thiocyanaticus]
MKSTMDRPGRIVWLLSLSAMVASCSGGQTDDLRQYTEEVRARQNTRVEPLPEFKPYETFLYQAGELRSPFRPSAGGAPDDILTESRDNGVRPDSNRPREALESFPLDTLRMVGTLDQGGQSWALVRANDGTIHRVQPGNHLGQNHGKIVNITEYEIELVEIVPDGLGGWIERQASLALSE